MFRLTLTGTVFLATAAWAAWLWAVPVVASSARQGSAGAVAAAVSFRLGGLVCHQQASRSLHVGRVQLPVCARCSGLYAGAPVGALAALVWLGAGRARRRPRTARLPAVRWAVALSAAPTAALWVAEHGLGLGVSGAARALAAMPLGATVAWLAAAAIGGIRVTDRAGLPGIN